MFYILFCCYILLSSLGLVLIKLGGSGTNFALGSQALSIQADFKFIIGLVCYVLSFLLFAFILQKRDLSFIYPLSAGVSNIISVICGVFILKESISVTEIIGIVIVTFGVITLNLGR